MVEIFFKELKQHLKIKSFIGLNENAMWIQIWTAMITILLLRIMKERAEFPWNLSNLVAFLRINLFVKIDLLRWLNKPFWLDNEIKSQLKQLGLFSRGDWFCLCFFYFSFTAYSFFFPSSHFILDSSETDTKRDYIILGYKDIRPLFLIFKPNIYISFK